jgi:hypothetical protein
MRLTSTTKFQLQSLNENLACSKFRARLYQVIAWISFLMAFSLPALLVLNWMSRSQGAAQMAPISVVTLTSSLAASVAVIGRYYLGRSMALLERVDTLRALKLLFESGYKLSPEFIMKYWTANAGDLKPPKPSSSKAS